MKRLRSQFTTSQVKSIPHSQPNIRSGQNVSLSPDAPVSQRKHAVDLARIRQISQLMDNHFRVPGTNIRFGLDSIIGLVPGVGDIVTSAIPLWIIYQARRAGVSRWTLARMVSNVAIDTVVGLVPFAGDAFDLVWKANIKNLKLLERELSRSEGSASNTTVLL